MTDKNENAKPKKALGQDPFADLDGFDLEEIGLSHEPAAEQMLEASPLDESPVLTAAAETAFEAVRTEIEPVNDSGQVESQPALEVETNDPPEVADQVESQPALEVETNDPFEVIDQVESQPALEVETNDPFEVADQVESQPALEVETNDPFEVADQVESQPALEVETNDPFEVADQVERQFALEVETNDPFEVADQVERQFALEVEANDPPESAGAPEKKTNHLLDDIIATIDHEMERVFEAESGGDGRAAEGGTGVGERQEQYIIFNLAGGQYAAPAVNVSEVSEITNLTPLPHVPAWLLGVTNLRGDILSVVDLRFLLGMAPGAEAEPALPAEALPGSDKEMLIAHPARDETLVTTGLVVDAVTDIRYLAVERIETPALSQKDQLTPYIQGVYQEEENLLVVLNLERLLLSPQIRQFETA